MNIRQTANEAVKDNGVRPGDDAAIAPAAYDPGGWPFASQVAICGIFLIVFIAALELARPVLLPATFAFVVGLMLGPLATKAKALGIPPLLTAIVLWLMVLVIVYGVIALLAAPAIDWIGKAAEIGQSLKDKFHFLNRPLQALQDVRNAILPEDKRTNGVGIDIVSFVQPVLTVITPAISQSLIFFGVLFFFLLGRSRLRQAIIAQFDDRAGRLRALKIMNHMEHSLTSYLSVVAVINLCVGVAASVIALAVGLPSPLAWGVLAFILNFIPYIGAIIIELVLLGVGVVTFPTLTHALIAPLLFLAFATLEGHFITPSIMGRRLTLIPLAVFLSLIFWTWLWGPAGSFLAVPLLIVGMVSIQHIFPDEKTILPG